MKITRVGVNLAKNVFQVHGVNQAGRTVFKRRLTRKNWLRYAAPSPTGSRMPITAYQRSFVRS